MARKTESHSKLRAHVGKGVCPDCGGDLGAFTACCFDCHDAELRAAGVDMTSIRNGSATRAAVRMVNRHIKVNPGRA